MTFSVYLRNTSGDHSSIKFGGYDTSAMPDDTELTILRTRDVSTWELKFKGNPMENRRKTDGNPRNSCI